MEDKKYLVIEHKAYMFYAQNKIFDNKEEAENYYYEAIEDYELEATLAEIKILKEWKKTE